MAVDTRTIRFLREHGNRCFRIAMLVEALAAGSTADCVAEAEEALREYQAAGEFSEEDKLNPQIYPRTAKDLLAIELESFWQYRFNMREIVNEELRAYRWPSPAEELNEVTEKLRDKLKAHGGIPEGVASEASSEPAPPELSFPDEAPIAVAFFLRRPRGD
jgi:hypothetical protein